MSGYSGGSRRSSRSDPLDDSLDYSVFIKYQIYSEPKNPTSVLLAVRDIDYYKIKNPLKQWGITLLFKTGFSLSNGRENPIGSSVKAFDGTSQG
jgi:hypothetical protein